MAMLKGVKLVVEHGFLLLIVEADPANAISWVYFELCPWHFIYMIRRGKMWAATFDIRFIQERSRKFSSRFFGQRRMFN
jgi:hypothetical protein